MLVRRREWGKWEGEEREIVRGEEIVSTRILVRISGGRSKKRNGLDFDTSRQAMKTEEHVQIDEDDFGLMMGVVRYKA